MYKCINGWSRSKDESIQISTARLYPCVCTLLIVRIRPMATYGRCLKKQEEIEKVSTKAVCAYVIRMRKEEEISLICCEPGVYP